MEQGQRPGKQPAQPNGLGCGGKIMSAEGAPAISFGFQVMRLARFQRLVSFCIRYLGRCPRLVAFRAFGPSIFLQSASLPSKRINVSHPKKLAAA
jgi:hypothetical protein